MFCLFDPQDKVELLSCLNLFRPFHEIKLIDPFGCRVILDIFLDFLISSLFLLFQTYNKNVCMSKKVE